ncbi:hypothetical protein [Tabrizicola flagellatus]|uniref:hypothetical protein n=1 Tax=Tabrizicola flagellatus TaxID=2593021 RepID=UPI0011F2CF84|nr:hypothetical protein [Tabrizicola flagellatus]
MRTPALCLAVLGALAACAPFPELDALGPDTAPPPRLLPIESLIGQAEVTAEDPGPALSARAARLKARAAAIEATPPAS